MTQILEVWADTGKVVQRERTADEQAQYELDQAASEAAAQTAVDDAAARDAARASGLAKLEALGLTHDEAVAVAGI